MTHVTKRTPDEEKRLRIHLAICACAYEFFSESLISDHEFDRKCLEVDPSVETGNPEYDKFWKEIFHLCTGSWVWRYPNLEDLKKKTQEMIEART